MTTEEAIDYLERCADGLDPDFDNAVSLAVAALRAQQETEKNEPLTLDKLREMQGEPVWVEVTNAPSLRWRSWQIVLAVDVEHRTLNCRGNQIFRNYGSAWLAYRHKPKEETK